MKATRNLHRLKLERVGQGSLISKQKGSAFSGERERMFVKALVLLLGLGLASVFYSPSLDEKSIQGLRVVVTGCTQGIGEKMAEEYSRMGAHVMLVARTESKLKRVQSKCKALGAASVGYVVADFSSTDEDLYKRVIDESVSFLGGGVDTMMLNHVSVVDMFHAQGAHKFRDMKKIRTLYEINTFSHMQLIHHSMDSLAESNGKIVFVSSMTGARGLPGVAPYSSTKHAMHGYLKSLRMDFMINDVPIDITICVVGSIATENNIKATEGTIAGKPKKAPVETTAMDIIRGGETRQREIYTPFKQVYPFDVMKRINEWFSDRLVWFVLGTDILERLEKFGIEI